MRFIANAFGNSLYGETAIPVGVKQPALRLSYSDFIYKRSEITSICLINNL